MNSSIKISEIQDGKDYVMIENAQSSSRDKYGKVSIYAMKQCLYCKPAFHRVQIAWTSFNRQVEACRLSEVPVRNQV